MEETKKWYRILVEKTLREGLYESPRKMEDNISSKLKETDRQDGRWSWLRIEYNDGLIWNLLN
jgi:hypothetical protein